MGNGKIMERLSRADWLKLELEYDTLDKWQQKNMPDEGF